MQSSPQEQSWKRFGPELILGAVVLIWASTFVITKDALEDFTPFSFIFARFGLILILAFSVLLVQGLRRGWSAMWHVDRADWPRFLLSGLLGYTFYQIGFTVGLDHTSPFSSSLLIAMVPLFTLVIATMLGERSSTGAWIGVFVAIVGVAVFLLQRQEGDSSALGNALSAGAAISFASYGLANRALVRKYPTATVSAYTTLLGTVPLLVISSPDAMRQDWSALEAQHWLTLLYMAIFPVYLVYIGYNWAIAERGISATSAGLGVPIVSGVLSAIVFSEAFGVLKVGGAVLVLLGLVLIQRSRMQAAKRGKAQVVSEAIPDTLRP